MGFRSFLRVTFALAAFSAAGLSIRSQAEDSPTPPAKPVLRAGAAAIDITPAAFPVIVNGGFTEQLATKAVDKLHARAIVLDDGTTKLAIVVVDSCGIEARFLDEAKRLASAATGIPTEKMLIAATHTHSAPSSWGALGSRVDERFTAGLIPQIVRAIRQASERLEAAQIGWTVVSAPRHTHNRRWILRSDTMQTDAFGARTVRAMMHPGYQNERYIGPSGPVDTDLSLVGIRAIGGRPIAALANYSQHYFGAPAVSADYYGRFAKRLTELIEADRVGGAGKAGVPGASGGVPGASAAPPQKKSETSQPRTNLAQHPRNWGGAPLAPGTPTIQPPEDSAGARLAPGTQAPPFVAIMSQGTSGDLMWMDYGAPKPTTTMKQYADELAALAHDAWRKLEYHHAAPLKMAEQKLKFRRRTPDAARLAWAKPILAAMGDRQPRTIQEVYATEAAFLQATPEVELKLQGVAIGELSIAAIPNEVFALTGLKLKRHSPFQQHFNMELANGTFGYIPPPEQHALGGYTTWPARSAGLEVRAEPKIVAALQGMLSGLANKGLLPDIHLLSEYEAAVIGSAPIAYWPLGDMENAKVRDIALGIGAERVPLKPRPTEFVATYEPGVALFLEGPPALGVARKVVPGDRPLGDRWGSRAAHFAGGRVRCELPKVAKNYCVEFWFWNGFPSDLRPVTGYLVSRGADGDAMAAGDHWGISGTLAPGEPGRLFFFNGNAAGEVVRGTTPLAVKTWNHVAVVREGDEVRAYLNGQEKPELCGRGQFTLPEKTANLFVGGRCDNFANFEGKLAQVAVYDRALPPSEIATHFRAATKAHAAAAPASKETSATKKTSAAPSVDYPDGSQPLPPAESLAAWQVKPGYRVELVAAEPLVIDPVAIDWGADGKLWVAEMADYPGGLDGKGKPGGRIRFLEDTDGDGRYDRSTLFLQGINFPNGILAWGRGVLCTAAPEIFYAEDSDGDGQADVRRTLYRGFAEGNQQLRVNGLRLGLDNWIYCASGAHFGGYGEKSKIRALASGASVAVGSRDFRIRPDQGLLDPQSGPAQFGRDRDDWGNWFGVQNSYPLWHYVLEDHYLRRNPLAAPPDPRRQLAEEANPKVYPASRIQKRYHNFQQSGRFTSACSPMIYRDELLFPRDAVRHSFTCEPVHNLVHHRVLRDDGVSFTAARPSDEQQREFLASSDPWCRPVMARTGPDGALWIVDIYRYMIEHPEWLPPDGKKELALFFRSGDDRGRIYRVTPIKSEPRTVPRLAEADSARLVATLESPNGPLRDMAQRLLVAKADAATVSSLTTMATTNPSPLARLHAICTLDGLGQLQPETIATVLADKHPGVRRQAVRLAESRPTAEVIETVAKMTTDPDAKVRLQLACTLGTWDSPAAAATLGKLAADCQDDPLMTAAVLSSVQENNFKPVAKIVFEHQPWPPLQIASRLCSMAVSLKQRPSLDILIRRAARPGEAGRFDVWQFRSLAIAIDALQQSGHEGAAEWSDELRSAVDGAVAQARRAAVDPKCVESMRVAAVALLLRQPEQRTADIQLLVKLLTPQVPAAVQMAAVERLARQTEPEAADMLLTPWQGYSPSIRAAVLAVVGSRPDWVPRLIVRLNDGTIRAAELSAATRQRLLSLANGKFKADLQKQLGSVTSDRQQALEQSQGALNLTADRTRGAAVFEKKCAACHQIGQAGRPIGPNLASLTNKTPAGLLESIIDPSRGVEAKYLNYVAELSDGRTFSGLLEVETGGSITLLTAEGQRQTILRTELEELRSSGKSLMPDGLEQDLRPQDLADLIGYLLSVE